MRQAPLTLILFRLSLVVLITSVLLPHPAGSSVTERLPFGNTGNAAAVMPALLEKTNKVRIDYADNMSVLITDDAWIGRLKKLLGGTGYKPTPYCFCSTPGGFILLADDSELARFTVPHGIKLRFLGSKSLHGDFLIEKAAAGAILALAREKQSLAVAQNHFIPPQPVLPEKLEFKP